jgi:hypothetical protein
MNGKKHRGCYSSEYKGVTWNKNTEKWQAQIKIDKNNKYLGLFSNEVDAAKTYDKAAKKLFGRYAKLNFPEEVITA